MVSFLNQNLQRIQLLDGLRSQWHRPLLSRFQCTSSIRLNQTQRDHLPLQDKTAFFGYEQTSHHKKTQKVQSVFSSVANKYDFMNDLMSLGIHRLWKQEFVKLMDVTGNYREPTKNVEIPSDSDPNKILSPLLILDLAGGTGDIAFGILDVAREKIPFGCSKIPMPKITVCDRNEEMLKAGKQRCASKNSEHIAWIVGDGENLPFEDNTFDIVDIAFGIRNFTDIDKGLSECYRVLKPGGRFLCLEFSKIQNPLLQRLYQTWAFNVIPCLGELVVNDRQSYQYLVESIEKFPAQTEFASWIWNSGFENVTYTSLTMGVVAIHSAFKKCSADN